MYRHLGRIIRTSRNKIIECSDSTGCRNHSQLILSLLNTSKSHKSLLTVNFSSSALTQNKNGDLNEFNYSEIQQIAKEIDQDFSSEDKKPEKIREQLVKNEIELESDEEVDAKDIMIDKDEESRLGKIPIKSDPIKLWSQFSSKYQDFSERPAQIIYDYNEELEIMEEGIMEDDIEEDVDPMEGIVLERGKTGVFDIEELVQLLREKNLSNIVTMKVPKHLKYVNYLVIATAKSRRQLEAHSEAINRIYKMKKGTKDLFLRIEGKKTDWVAMDLGNIALHLMIKDMREAMDIETLWTVGWEHDENCQQDEEHWTQVIDPIDPLAGFYPSSTVQRTSK